MFAMLEPTTLPSAIPELPLSEAVTVTTSSGRLVPNATTVSPITAGAIPKERARAEDPFTKSAAPP